MIAAGFTLFLRSGVGGSYWSTIFPAVIVLGAGMAISVAPLTTTVMESVPSSEAGVASGVNNAVSRIAGLLAIAVFGLILSASFNHALDRSLSRIQLSPDARERINQDRLKLAGLQTSDQRVRDAVDEAFLSGYHNVLWISVGLAILSSVSAQMITNKREKLASVPR